MQGDDDGANNEACALPFLQQRVCAIHHLKMIRCALETDEEIVRRILVSANKASCLGCVKEICTLVRACCLGETILEDPICWEHYGCKVRTVTSAHSFSEVRKLAMSAIPPNAHAARVLIACEKAVDIQSCVAIIGKATLLLGADSDATLRLRDCILRHLSSKGVDPHGFGIHGLLQPQLAQSLRIRQLRTIFSDAFARAAHLASLGKQSGAKHGCVIFDPASPAELRIIGEGFNDKCIHENRTRVVHAEAAAVADALKRHGTFSVLASCAVAIVEVSKDGFFEQAHPCPKCAPLIKGIGASILAYSRRAVMPAVVLMPANKGDLDSIRKTESVRVPLKIALRAKGVELSSFQF